MTQMPSPHCAICRNIGIFSFGYCPVPNPKICRCKNGKQNLSARSLHSVVTFSYMRWTCFESSRFSSQSRCNFCNVNSCAFRTLNKESLNFFTWPFKLLILGLSNSCPSSENQFSHRQPNERFHITLHAVSLFAVGESSEFSGRASEIPLLEYSKIYLYGLFVLQLWKRATFSLVRSRSCVGISRNCWQSFLPNFGLNIYTY